ncbi:hypothetical protein AB2H63_26555 (plasmid) [Escherichia coli]|uniref:hypothetical protein n=1 Tax=Escherichia coli TaxID=562 RepID=UPI00131A2AB3|nr:hypothetical protein [Escherichia coli]EFS3906973.1 hypothetical protein [Shigella flexneri]DAL66141.1 MAG TPA_asm: hypothetical protein [Caudoviricetes sp.]MCN3167470.1 hypothetical protein [Escherichia coli]HAI6711439.1 hypothetical protein [Escherichia coli]HAL2349232.1 hypothetical protein [Escherichia coli]
METCKDFKPRYGWRGKRDNRDRAVTGGESAASRKKPTCDPFQRAFESESSSGSRLLSCVRCSVFAHLRVGFFRVFVMVSDFAAVYKLTIKVNANDDLMMVAA